MVLVECFCCSWRKERDRGGLRQNVVHDDKRLTDIVGHVQWDDNRGALAHSGRCATKWGTGMLQFSQKKLFRLGPCLQCLYCAHVLLGVLAVALELLLLLI